MDDKEYKYYMSVNQICEACGYDHAKAGVNPIIIMEDDAAGAFCTNCHETLKFTIIEPSMMDFYDDQL